MRACLMALWVLCALALSISAQTSDGGRRFDAPPPKAARDLVKRGVQLAGQDRVDEAIAAVKKATAIAPNYLEAHLVYLRLKVDFQGKVDEVRSEYESLMAKEPDNPIYPTAMSQALSGRVVTFPLLKKVAELAPEWSWGHYAQSWVILGRGFDMIGEKYDGKGDQILGEVLKAIEKDGAVKIFYVRAIDLQERLGRLDEAILIAEKMAAQPELRSDGLAKLWRLRLTKAKGAEAEKESLRAELARLSSGSRDIVLLATIRDAHDTLLKDPVRAAAIERQIHRLDPTWYPERGSAMFIILLNNTRIPFPLLAANRQFAIYEKLHQIVLQREADTRKEMRQIESLLLLSPNQGVKEFIYAALFSSARQAEDVPSMIKYAEQLLLLNARNTAPLARIALTMAKNKTALPRALRYARRAESAVAQFHLMQRPPEIPARDFESRFSLKDQQENFRRQQALALDAEGYVLFQMGQTKEAETKLRRSVELNKTETSLSHLAATLKSLGLVDEADKIAQELDASMLESIKRQFINTPSKDFQLEAIDGRRYRLSDLKGKVVLVSFWATWCGPCVGEMPLLAKTYAKYKDRGFEILAVSGDDPGEREKVLQFAKTHGLTFPVLYDDGVARLYDVVGYPGNIFIDRQGNIRYSQDGAFDEGDRRLEIILGELLK
jgi:peroxiredoxin/Tfp pilus assembly protein PilF